MENNNNQYDRGYNDGYKVGHRKGREEGERRRDDERSARMGSAAVSASERRDRERRDYDRQSIIAGIQTPRDSSVRHMPLWSAEPAMISPDADEEKMRKIREELGLDDDQDG